MPSNVSGYLNILSTLLGPPNCSRCQQELVRQLRRIQTFTKAHDYLLSIENDPCFTISMFAYMHGEDGMVKFDIRR